MGELNCPPGPFARHRDGYCEQARGVIEKGHVVTITSAHFAQENLTAPHAAAEDRRRAFVCLDTLIDAQIPRRTIAKPLNVAGLDGRGTWCMSVGDTSGGGPHFNLEEFIGSEVVQILLEDRVKDHGDWPKGLQGRLEQCLANAVRCAMRRSVRLSYTNPVAMGIECSALAGELLGIAEFIAYARRRLAAWRKFTERAGTFEEFNSSCYGGVTLPHVAYLTEWVRDKDIRVQALYMERLYFDHVCDFLHAPTGELSMPQSRAYSDRLADTQLHDYLSHVLAERGLTKKARAAGLGPPPAAPGLGRQYYCHATARQIERLFRRFHRPRESRVFCEWIGRDHVGPLRQVPPPSKGPHTRRRQLVNWRTAEFCVGSVSEIDSWDQRRALGGFIRTGHGSVMVAWKPVITVTGCDEDEQQHRWPTLMYFNLCTGQDRSTVLAGVSPVPIEGGWLCGSHWRQKVQGKVRGLSADFGFDLDGLGQADRLPPLEAGRTWQLNVGQCTVSLLFMGGHIDATQAQPRVAKTPTGWRISLLRQEDFQLDWARPPEVALAFVLDFSPRERQPTIRDAAWRLSGTVLSCEAIVERRRLSLRYDPPGIDRLTKRARFFDVQES